MHERYKLREAKFFLARMEESVEDREAFRYYLSAFLSAARSVLQYARKESEENGRLDWYDTTVARSDVLRFFKDKRNVNIHGEPISPSRDISIVISEAICVFSSAAPVVVIGSDGPVAPIQPQQEPSPPTKQEPPPPTPPENRSQTTVRDYFNDWPGPEDIFKLSHRYIEELERFVQSGMKIGILSG